MVAEDQPLLRVRDLAIDRPGGGRLLEGVDLELAAGEIAVLLGGSGAGKSTLVAALQDQARLEEAGFRVRADEIHIATPIGIVPQRGALFDHLSVAGNIALAMRNAESPKSSSPAEIEQALVEVDLPESWAERGRDVAHVSGGEAQRVAVARTLAGGRRILFFDEPSVGLDPHRVNMLADLLRREMRQRGAAALVVTHDLAFAAGFADRFLYVDRDAHCVEDLGIDVGPDVDRRSLEDRRRVEDEVEDAVVQRLSAEGQGHSAPARGSLVHAVGRRIRQATDSLEVVPRVLAALPQALARPRDFFEVFRVVLKQAVVRPAPFFAIVSVLIGFTLLYIFHRSFAGGAMPVRSDKIFTLIGSMHIIALAPALTGILFAATSANAITAWLGGMSLTRQTAALRALGIQETRYLWLPAWLGLGMAFLLMVAIFTAGMVAGGALYLELRVPEIVDAYAVITADLFDPPPARELFRSRAFWLVGLYAVGIGADGVAKGAREKSSAESVTVAMVRSVMAVTLWIVALELASLVFVYSV